MAIVNSYVTNYQRVVEHRFWQENFIGFLTSLAGWVALIFYERFPGNYQYITNICQWLLFPLDSITSHSFSIRFCLDQWVFDTSKKITSSCPHCTVNYIPMVVYQRVTYWKGISKWSTIRRATESRASYFQGRSSFWFSHDSRPDEKNIQHFTPRINTFK